MFRKFRTTFAGTFVPKLRDQSGPLIEGLEDRQFLSATTGPIASLPAKGKDPAVAQAKVQPSAALKAAQAGALAGIAAGDEAKIVFSALDPAKAIAVAERPDGAHCGAAGATVVSTDATASTITVSAAARDGTATTTTYKVSPTATITADGAAVTLSQLVAGVKVKFATDPTDATVVTSITATGAEVHGRLSAIDATAGTVTPATTKGGVATTYAIPSAATVTVNGITSTLGNAMIVVGSKVEIHFSALDETRIVGVAIY